MERLNFLWIEYIIVIVLKKERENCKLFIKKKIVIELIDFFLIGRMYVFRGGILKIESIGDLDGLVKFRLYL